MGELAEAELYDGQQINPTNRGRSTTRKKESPTKSSAKGKSTMIEKEERQLEKIK